MQTFLPHPEFAESARVLDRQRLGKQRVETKQLLQAILGTGSRGWASHPAAKMWVPHPWALAAYGMAVCEEWRNRGYKDTLYDWFRAEAATLAYMGRRLDHPRWLGDDRFHSSHRACLLAKDPEWYGQFGWTEQPTPPAVEYGPRGGKKTRWPYVWPEV